MLAFTLPLWLREDRRQVLMRTAGGGKTKRPGKPCGKGHISASYRCRSHYTNGKLNAEGKAAMKAYARKIKEKKGIKPKSSRKEQPKIAKAKTTSSLPPLKGSAKQVEWAEKIRANTIKKVAQQALQEAQEKKDLSFGLKPFDMSAERKKIEDAYLKEISDIDSARKWIDGRQRRSRGGEPYNFYDLDDLYDRVQKRKSSKPIQKLSVIQGGKGNLAKELLERMADTDKALADLKELASRRSTKPSKEHIRNAKARSTEQLKTDLLAYRTMLRKGTLSDKVRAKYESMEAAHTAEIGDRMKRAADLVSSGRLSKKRAEAVKGIQPNEAEKKAASKIKSSKDLRGQLKLMTSRVNDPRRSTAERNGLRKWQAALTEELTKRDVSGVANILTGKDKPEGKLNFAQKRASKVGSIESLKQSIKNFRTTLKNPIASDRDKARVQQMIDAYEAEVKKRSSTGQGRTVKGADVVAQTKKDLASVIEDPKASNTEKASAKKMKKQIASAEKTRSLKITTPPKDPIDFFMVDVSAIEKPSGKGDKSVAQKLASAANKMNGDIMVPAVLRQTGPMTYKHVGDRTLYDAAETLKKNNPQQGEMVNSFVAKNAAEAQAATRQQRIAKANSDPFLPVSSAKNVAKQTDYLMVDVSSIKPRLGASTFKGGIVNEMADAIVSAGGSASPMLLKQTGPEKYEVLSGHLSYHASVEAKKRNPRAFEMANAFVVGEGQEQAALEQVRAYSQHKKEKGSDRSTFNYKGRQISLDAREDGDYGVRFAGRNTGILVDADSRSEAIRKARKKKKRGGDKAEQVWQLTDKQKKQAKRGEWVRTVGRNEEQRSKRHRGLGPKPKSA